MTAPLVSLDVGLYYDSRWNDISGYVYQRDPITISRGRPNEATSSDPSVCTLTLDNRDGRFSPRNPLSPLYGKIGRNTPLRVRAPYGVTALDCVNTAGSNATTPDAAALDITGDIDLRAEFRSEDAAQTQTILSKASSGQRSYALWLGRSVNGYPQLSLFWSTDGANTNQIDHEFADISIFYKRVAVRVELDVNNGLGGYTVRVYTADSIGASSWVQHGNQHDGAAITSIFAGTAALRVGENDTSTFADNPFIGKIYAVQVRSSIGGTMVANPDFTAQAVGAGSFADAAGRTWTIGAGAKITDLDYRFCGEVSAWPKSWDVSGKDKYVQVQAGGVLRRLGQGQPAHTLSYREYLESTNPYVYFPLDDAAGSRFGAHDDHMSALSTSYAFRSVGTGNVWAFGDGDLGTDMPKGLSLTKTGSANSGRMQGQVFAPQSMTAVCVDYVYKTDTNGLGIFELALVDYIGQTWRPQLRADGAHWDVIVNLDFYDPSIEATASTSLGNSADNLPALTDDQLHLVRFTLTENGANVDWSASIDGVTVVSGTRNNTSVGGLDRIEAEYLNGASPVALGHLAVYVNGFQPAIADVVAQLTAHSGETAADRIARLCFDNGVPLVIDGARAGTAAMGAQGASTLVSLLREAADTDLGVLYEPRSAAAIGYRARTDLYNQAAALTLDYSANVLGSPPDPTDDDQELHNLVTVTNAGGRSAVAELTEGPASTQAPPNGVSTYPQSYSVNLETDGPLPDHAAWRLHLGTVDEDRWPQLTVNLLGREIAGNPALRRAIVAADVGDKLVLQHLPAVVPPDDVNLQALGYREDLGPFLWEITFNCTPNSPYEVAVYGTDRFDAEDSSLSAGATSGAATLSAASASGTELWTADATATPFDIIVGGERVTVDAVGAVLNSNPRLLTDASGWVGAGATIGRSTAVVHTDKGAVASLLITPDGVSASGGANESPHSAVGSITPTAQYKATMWAYSPGGWADLRATVDWFDAADVFLSTSLGVGTAVPAGVWTPLEQILTAPASASRASLRARHGGTPAAGNIWYVWNLRLIPVSSYAASPQTLTVVRSVNGVVKAHSAGEQVRLFKTPRFAL